MNIDESASGTITDLLQAWRESRPEADEKLMEAVYSELRHLARVFLKSERDSHTLAPSDLIHETYLRLRGRRHAPWRDRHHFFAAAAQCMRRLLVEHARSRLLPKRGRANKPLPLEEAGQVYLERAPELVALDDALNGLSAIDPFKAQLVELRFFGGFSIPETAKILGCSHATVERHWRLAQGWLYAEMKSDEAADAESQLGDIR